MDYLEMLGQKAAAAKYELQKLTTLVKNDALQKTADALVKETQRILTANEKDYVIAKQNGMTEGLLDRLKLTPERVEGMAEGLRQIAELDDPVGEIIESFDRPNGLHIDKVRVPMAVKTLFIQMRQPRK